MQNTTPAKASDLIYQGPLIGMRSTRPKPTPQPANNGNKKQ
jgi:hypothetical protein